MRSDLLEQLSSLLSVAQGRREVGERKTRRDQARLRRMGVGAKMHFETPT